ncbi:hypothetical protein L1D19_23850 [Vibrio natriegens]|uniref:hypothetical protein n=1 Tax=Vibrio natriegens TaxID=691 RepID=UPI001EFCB3EF|nr:hypothetical protein [Vibrio natriegens]MCG9703101.1 hypothetical protein [Vibrio natriegens]
MLMHRVIDHLDEALSYISKRSLRKGDNDDIWDLRFQWPRRKAELRAQLLSQTYVFSPCQVFEYQPGKVLHTFRSVDKLVLKALALTLIEVLPRSPLCFSYAGHGGVPGALCVLPIWFQNRRGGLLRLDRPRLCIASVGALPGCVYFGAALPGVNGA